MVLQFRFVRTLIKETLVVQPDNELFNSNFRPQQPLIKHILSPPSYTHAYLYDTSLSLALPNGIPPISDYKNKT